MLLVTLILLGILRICITDPLSPGSLFLIFYSSSFLLAGILHKKLHDICCGMVYLFLIPTMYQILIIFSFFNFNDISWGTREADNKNAVKDPISNFFQMLLEQPALGWLFKCCKQPAPETEEMKLAKKEQEDAKKAEKHSTKDPQILKFEETLAASIKEEKEEEKKKKEEKEKKLREETFSSPGRLKEKREQEKTWLAYLVHQGLENERKRTESGIVQVNINEAEILNDLGKIKYNVLWVVASANIIFFTLIVALSTMQDFNVLNTNVNAFSLFLLLLFGIVQIIQTICMIFDGVKSWARRLSYI